MLAKITSGYGWRVVFGQRNFHRGLDTRSRLGDDRIALFSGRVVKVTRGRRAGADVGKVSNGVPAHAYSLSGNAVTIERADGRGYYVEVHIDPAVDVGDRVVAGQTVLGQTDLSGSITAAHSHVELWRRNDPDTYYDPTAEMKAAASGKGTGTPTPAPEEDDMFTDAHAKQLKDTATRVTYMREKQLPAIHQEVVDRATLVSTAGAKRDAALQAQITALSRVVAAGTDLDVPALLADVEDAAERGVSAAIQSIDTTVTITKE